jgi:DNA repair photolyase
MAEIQKAEIDEDSIFDYLLKSPSRLLIILAAYITLMVIYFYFLRMRRRKKRMLDDILQRRMMERERIQMEIQRLKELLNSERIEKEERGHLEERLEMLFERLTMIEEKYYRQHGL